MRFTRSRIYCIFLVAIIIVIALQFFNVYKTPHNDRTPSPIPEEPVNIVDIGSTITSTQPTTTFQEPLTTEGYIFPDILSDLSLTCRGKIFLYIVVISDKINSKQRQKIRQSWASIKFINQKLISSVFLVTHDQKSIPEHQSLAEEAHKYQDIFYSNYTVSDSDLLNLYLDSLKVATACNTSQYYLVIKEDMFPNIPAILNEISPNVTLMCNVHINNRVVRNTQSPYYLSQSDYRNDIYPPHCKNGSPFIISADLARFIIQNYTKLNINFYDAYLLGVLPYNFNSTPVEFPKTFSIIEMRPHFVYLSQKLYGILTNGILLPGRIWKKLMLQMVLK